MSPNTERDERVRRIRERHCPMARRECPTPKWQMREDIDYLLSLLDSQAECGDLKSRDDVLAFFGGSITEDGLLHIDMKKYHAAHLCQEHAFQPWRRSEIEEKCVMCIARDAANAATAMRDRCVMKVRELQARFQQEAQSTDDYEYGSSLGTAAMALDEAATTLESLTLDQVEQEK